MTLLDLTEPLFQYVCRLNRVARKGAGSAPSGGTSFFTKAGTQTPKGPSVDYAVVRSEIKALLEDFMQKASSDMRLSSQSKKIELPLIFFVDSMIAESSLGIAQQWNQNRLAYDRNELAGDEKFFDLLEETLGDSSEDASERLAVYYICIGLGFTGIYFKQPEYLRKSMLTIAPRIRHLVETDQMARICPEAYTSVDTRDLVRPPGDRMLLVGIIFICFSLSVFMTYFFMYRNASQHLNSSLDQILEQDISAAAPRK
ncbi:MAG: type secretion system protein DotU family [Pedosphaera sp.]|nr:type secretion system protein DotU family [Pedosphaera sp.]